MSYKNLNNLLKSVSVNGAINECSLQVNQSVGSIAAIDPTNTIFVLAKEKIEIKEAINLGILDIGGIIKFLNGLKEEDNVEYEVDKNHLVFKVAGKGLAKFSLSDYKTISTAIKAGQEEKIKKIIESKTLNVFSVTESFIKKFEYFSSLFQGDNIKFKLTGGKLKVSGGKDMSSFTFSEKTNIKKEINIEISVDTAHLISIFSLLFAKKEDFYISFEENSPFIIKSKTVVWVLAN